jgi:hypothetical protein
LATPYGPVRRIRQRGGGLPSALGAVSAFCSEGREIRDRRRDRRVEPSRQR